MYSSRSIYRTIIDGCGPNLAQLPRLSGGSAAATADLAASSVTTKLKRRDLIKGARGEGNHTRARWLDAPAAKSDPAATGTHAPTRTCPAQMICPEESVCPRTIPPGQLPASILPLLAKEKNLMTPRTAPVTVMVAVDTEISYVRYSVRASRFVVFATPGLFKDWRNY